ncbi:MAG: PAS domain-containing sensor histidine kinase [Chroococcales cyanobacterium]
MAISTSTTSEIQQTNPKPTVQGSMHSAESQFFLLSLDMFFVIGGNGLIEQVNPACCETLGFTQSFLCRQSWDQFLHPEDRVLSLAKMERLLTSGNQVSFESRFRCQNGSYLWLLWNATFSQEEQRIYAVARNISDRKQTQQDLEDSEERFRLLVESVKDYAIYMLDPTGHVVSWNQGTERLNGYQSHEIIGQHYSCFHPPEDRENGVPELVLNIAANEGRLEYETWRLRRDGSGFWADVVVTALKDQDQHLRGFAVVTCDITERKQAKEDLEKANNELEKRVIVRTSELQAAIQLLKQEISDRKQTELALRQSQTRLKKQAIELEQALAKLQKTQTQLVHAEKISGLGQLVAGIAHELNNPVSFIYGNVEFALHYISGLIDLLELYQTYYPQPHPEIQELEETLELDYLVEDLPKLLSSMKTGSERIHEIILSLRHFARHDEADKKEVNLHEGIDSTLLILQHRLKGDRKHPTIEVIKDYGNLPTVECYSGQLNQVFLNILTNAIDGLQSCFAFERVSKETQQETPTISISTDIIEVSGQEKVVIRIADNGPGIPPKVQQRIFDPFFTTKQVGQGTGLGLSISYQIIVEKHQGQLMFTSEPGKGTEFVIEIPTEQSQSLPVLSNCA